MYSFVTQNSIFKLRQNISLVIYRRKPLSSERLEQQNFPLPVAPTTNLNTAVAGSRLFLPLRCSVLVRLGHAVSVQVLDPKKEEKCKTVLADFSAKSYLFNLLILLLNRIWGSNIIFRTLFCLKKLILSQITSAPRIDVIVEHTYLTTVSPLKDIYSKQI